MKKNILVYIRLLICSVVLLLVSYTSQARHILGVDFYYTWVSDSTYKITLVAYGNCGLTGAGYSSFEELSTSTPFICIYDGDTYTTSLYLNIVAPSAGVNVTPVCPQEIDSTNCTSDTYPIQGVTKFVYTGTYTLPHASTVWRFIYLGYMGPLGAGAARTGTITNITGPTGTFIGAIDTLNSTINNHHNSNPILTALANPYFCDAEPATYNPGAVDADGDSLAFFLVPALNSTATYGDAASCASNVNVVNYLGTNTATAPMNTCTSSFSFTSATGQITFNPSSVDVPLVVYNIEEYRHDTLIGTSQREMTIHIIPCTGSTPGTMVDTLGGASNGVVVDNTHFQICQNSGAFNVSINPREPGSSNTISDSASGLPAGATFTTTGNGTTTPNSTISWTSNSVTPGSYTIYITFYDNNCPLPLIQTVAYNITILASPTIHYSQLSGATCTAKSAISLIPGGTSPWTITGDTPTGDTTISPVSGTFTDSLNPGSYKFYIVNPSSPNCIDSVSLIVAPPIYITPTVVSATNPTICGDKDGTITMQNLIPGSIDTIQFDTSGIAGTAKGLVAADGSLVLTGLPAGVYSNFIYKTAKNICAPAVPGPITLTNPPVLPPVITNNTPICLGQTLHLTANDTTAPDGNYLWTFPDGSTTTVQNPTITNATLADSGLYTVAYNIAPNCTGISTQNVLVFPPIALTNVTPNTVIPYGTSIHLNVDGALYYWWRPDNGSLDNPNINDPVAKPQQTTLYTVIGTSLYGCTDSANVLITVDSSEHILIPSAFSPNNDGLNDVFRIRNVTFEQLNDFSIFNRWGQLVYHNSYDIQQGWDGTFNGVPQDVGVYNYVIIVSYPEGATKMYKGDVTLVR